MGTKLIKLFLRLALAAGFLSAVADRFGLWSQEVSVWGTWPNFLDYTAVLNPWFPSGVIPALGIVVTVLEVVLAVCLLVGYKTRLMARLSGWLLLIFALSMTFSTGVKGALDFAVFSAAAAAFALGVMRKKFLEVDGLISRKRSHLY